MNQSDNISPENPGLKKRVLQYYDEACHIHRVIESGEGELPPPKMVFLFPTYRCSLNCKNCMYGDYIKKCKDKGHLDIDLELFKHILDDLFKLGVKNVEITGGGEPLEHREISELIKIIHQYSSKIDFGLLSNGINLYKLDSDVFKLLMESSTYIRLSYSEATSSNQKLRDRYLKNLNMLLKYKEKEGYKVKIGAKLLLTRENTDQITQDVDHLYKLGLGHLKVKSIRSKDDEPTLEDIIKLENELNTYKNNTPVKEVLDIDLRKTEYPPDFRCWINPLITTIDPLGHIYLCYNYHNDPTNIRIGNYTPDNSLSDFWGKEDHLSKIKNINTDKVCKAHNACNCRFADYQQIMEEIIKENNLKVQNKKLKMSVEDAKVYKFL